MATLHVPRNGKARKGSSRKPIPTVDLTAMVDLAFLLITFFMLTTSLSKMNAMDIAKPDLVPQVEKLEPWPALRTLTVLLGKNNKAVYYLGEAHNATMKKIDLAQMRKILIVQKAIVAEAHSKDKEKAM